MKTVVSYILGCAVAILMAKIGQTFTMSTHPANFDSVTFGHRVRHFRHRKGLTLDQLGALVGRPAPFLSLVENGKKEPRISQIADLAVALDVSVGDLLSPEAPNRRAQLEIDLERYQARFGDLDLPYLKSSSRLSDEALTHLVSLYRLLVEGTGPGPVTAGEVRRINGEMTAELRSHDGYLPEVEAAAASVVARIGYSGAGALSSRNILDLAALAGFEIKPIEDIPSSLRSVTDLANRVIYIAQRNELRTRQARKAILQTLGRFFLGHGDPTNYGEFLRHRRLTAYFASAVLVPGQAALTRLTDAHRQHDLSVEDLRELFYVSYQTAAHRMINLSTHHLAIKTHMVVSDEEGIALKAYENDGAPFPRDEDGGVEAQRLCREWSARVAFDSADKFSMHYQYTDTPAGTFFCSTYVDPDPNTPTAITFGVGFDDARLLRGRETTNHRISRCPDGTCCRRPAGDIATRWEGKIVASPRAQARIIGMLAPDPYPKLDLAQIYELVERHQPRSAVGNS
ncbi:MAG: XRE family transcriptional regulator [Acidimicrobiia bacterium]|nr:XRE family transcriptional regulator [Acidimicrobiia bacterium]